MYVIFDFFFSFCIVINVILSLDALDEKPGVGVIEGRGIKGTGELEGRGIKGAGVVDGRAISPEVCRKGAEWDDWMNGVGVGGWDE